MKKRFTSVEIGSRKYKVKYLKYLGEDNGRCSYNRCWIKLKTWMVHDDHIGTFFHECAHLVLFAMGQDKLANDETFVESLGDKMAQIYKTLK